MAGEINIVATTGTNTATMEPGSSCMDESTLEESKQSLEATEHISENELKTEGEEHSSIVQDDNFNLPKETIEEEGPGAQALKRCLSQPQTPYSRFVKQITYLALPSHVSFQV